jgi:hypothetical protein
MALPNLLRNLRTFGPAPLRAFGRRAAVNLRNHLIWQMREAGTKLN